MAKTRYPYGPQAASKVDSEALAQIFNASVTIGAFPKRWKTSRIKPLWKEGNLDSIAVSLSTNNIRRQDPNTYSESEVRALSTSFGPNVAHGQMEPKISLSLACLETLLTLLLLTLSSERKFFSSLWITTTRKSIIKIFAKNTLFRFTSTGPESRN